MACRARAPGVDGVLAARPDGSGRYARLRCAGDDFLGSDAPPGLGAGSGLMYAGAALFSGRALEKIDEANFFASIARHGLRFKIVPYDGIWLDIGTPASYLQANWEYRAHAALPPGNSLSAGAVVSPAARVERSLLWEGARIGAGVRLAECIVTQNVELAAGEHVRQIVCPDGVFPIA
jgi:NDP-sugar pyrophosphorylase family protein